MIQKLDAGVDYVLTNELITSDTAATDGVGGREQLGWITDGKKRFSTVDEVTCEFIHGLIYSQLIRRVSFGNQQSVKMRHRIIFSSFVNGNRRARLFALNRLPAFEADVRQVVSGIFNHSRSRVYIRANEISVRELEKRF